MAETPGRQMSRSAIRLTHFIGYPNQYKIGDYITVVSDNAGANVAYAATFNGEEDIYYVRIRSKRLEPDHHGRFQWRRQA